MSTDSKPNFCQCQGCTARTKLEGEWLCSRHWKLVPADTRKSFTKSLRLLYKVRKAYEAGVPLKRGGSVPSENVVRHLTDVMWRRWWACKVAVRTVDGEPPPDLAAFMREIGLFDPDALPPTSLG